MLWSDVAPTCSRIFSRQTFPSSTHNQQLKSKRALPANSDSLRMLSYFRACRCHATCIYAFHIAISACSFLSSSSSSSSSSISLRPFGVCGNCVLSILSPTGTLPAPSILVSSSVCSSSSSSAFSSSSSSASDAAGCVSVDAISSPMACCSRRSSLLGDAFG